MDNDRRMGICGYIPWIHDKERTNRYARETQEGGKERMTQRCMMCDSLGRQFEERLKEEISRLEAKIKRIKQLSPIEFGHARCLPMDEVEKALEEE